MIYLCKPIDKRTDPKLGYSRLVECLRLEGVTSPMYIPVMAFDVQPDGMTDDQHHAESLSVALINTDAIKHSSVLLLDYEPDQETWGCAQELIAAVNFNVPILAVIGRKEYRNLPIYIKAWVPPSHVVQTYIEAVAVLEQIERGETE